MSIGGGERHIIYCKANLETDNGILKVKLPFDNIETNLWQLRFYEIAFMNLTNNPINDLLTISTNIIKDTKYNQNKEIITYFPFLNFFDLSLKSANYKVFRLEESWFYVNNPSELIEIYISRVTTESLFNKKCQCFAILHLQKIK